MVSQELGRVGLMKHNPGPCEVSCWSLTLSSLALGFVWVFVSKEKKSSVVFLCTVKLKCLGINSKRTCSELSTLWAKAGHLMVRRVWMSEDIWA